jgi:hypothetical protein
VNIKVIRKINLIILTVSLSQNNVNDEKFHFPFHFFSHYIIEALSLVSPVSP